MATKRRRRLIAGAIGVVVLIVLAAVLGPYIYIHFIEGPAPAKLELPKSPTSSTSSTSKGSAAPSSSLDGNWKVGAGSMAGYRVQEVLVGQNATAVGRTNKLWGSLSIAGSTVTKGTFTVDMASVVSDQSERNARFDGPIMDVSQYPTATLTLSAPIDLGTIPAEGAVAHYSAAGNLTLHGVTKSVNFPVTAERVGAGIDVLADVPITFSKWNIADPSIGGFVTTASNGTLEVLLHLTQGPGNPVSTSSGSANPVGGGGPVTVPSTTVPPLRVPFELNPPSSGSRRDNTSTMTGARLAPLAQLSPVSGFSVATSQLEAGMARGSSPRSSWRGSVTTVEQPLRDRRSRVSRSGSGLRRLSGWGPALVSFALAVAYGLYIALRTYEVDLGVYLRLGGRYVFTSHLYSFVLPNTSLPFTYPPFAALLFAPWQRTFSGVGSVQAVWTMGNLAALVGVLVLSVRLVKPSLDRMATWRLALALSLPAVLLNPVLITIGFGQVNLFVTFLVMWDLLSERKIGKRQLPLGVATGLAAAVKLTPLLFVPYLVITRRWRGL